MSLRPKLESPINLPIPSRDPCYPGMEPSEIPEDFIKQGHPYRLLHRFFIGIEPGLTDIDAIEFTNQRPVSYVKKFTSKSLETDTKSLVETSHPNLVNLREVFIHGRSCFFLYERWSLSLKEVQKLGPVFQLSEVEVASICYKIFMGLLYIHETLKISHGNIHMGNVFICEDGEVKIGDIGESMIHHRDKNDKARDIVAVFCIARTLLISDKAMGRGAIGLLCQDFTSAHSSASIAELIQDPGAYDL
ncbi:hypothetical protein BO99DRAFT_409571 [Aspergillus violaceofuscus CBS 115571]|uniref:Protein kinase domain-containing protein n=1 Tax=Aspergillus violaceofuscus (strain CBS 115571) TaxID=1450538 RepID=A0A2V5HMC7_ASPV1|nr:hypothetical protein BO99DRAFT_409571 [Aspergillus violaceofuscus CBS 115571]